MADKSINQLPVSDGLTDDGLLVVYQNNETKSIRGEQIRRFAEQGIENALANAKESGEFDGEDGYTPVKGKDYFDGEDGISPTVLIESIDGGHKLTITDKDGKKSVNVMDGTDGDNGDDGISPTITVENIAGGYRFTITDATGTKSVDVLNGTGAGDMLSAVYDPTGKARDVFAYVDDSVKNAVSKDDIDAAVNDALEEAKTSGEFDGEDGVGIASVIQTTTSTDDDGNNIITITLTDGKNFAFTVQNGSKGSSGYTPQKGVDYFDGKSAYQSAQGGGFSGTETEFNAELSEVGNKANKSTVITATLAVSGWADGAYILTVDGVTTTSNQEILPAVNITAEQLEALQAANIQDGGQTAGNITLKAFGDVPTIDIPIRVIKRGD